ncbi:minor capsid protein [Acinetobacter courvalinii]|uniref:minor capsid protein n=1 Tax=Acinetobacter courvalinii TaxID=280147 RepID=UPI0019020EA1|nr:minor capsid protein [Acinetobacter courvalinii]MBJ8417541.1 minor capsid protein [Acinetobacter courvalinii]
MANHDKKILFNILTQHQAYLYRAASRSVNELLGIFNDETMDMLSRLNGLLDQLNVVEKIAVAGGQYTTANLRATQKLIQQWFNSIDIAISERFTVSAISFAGYEANYMAKLFGHAKKADKGEQLYMDAKHIPLAGGALVDELLSKIAETARQRVEYAIRDGMNTGMSNYQIIKRLRGTKRLKYEDGLLNSSRTDIERTVRTIRSHVSNQAYLNSFKELDIQYIRFISVLDGRTSKLCAALDGSVWKINDRAKRIPPLHPNCRSTLVPVDKDGQLIGQRPYVMDERKLKDIPKHERAQLTGQLDANITFKEFFNKTDDFFQKEWLGPKRYKLYKEGKFDFDKFFDPEGELYSLEQLRILDEQTFKVLGI